MMKPEQYEERNLPNDSRVHFYPERPQIGLDEAM